VSAGFLLERSEGGDGSQSSPTKANKIVDIRDWGRKKSGKHSLQTVGEIEGGHG